LELERALASLCDALPGAVGAVLCDEVGETVVCVPGPGRLPPEAEAEARRHAPRNLPIAMPLGEFLLRLGGAEPATLLELLGAGARRHRAGPLVEVCSTFAEVVLLMRPLPDDLYLVLVLRRPVVLGVARRALAAAAARVARDLAAG
jgi:hypothetical protein